MSDEQNFLPFFEGTLFGMTIRFKTPLVPLLMLVAIVFLIYKLIKVS